ncbi:MAG TPA: TIGR02679 family protein [Ilumatobacter sp.]|nr:TIGR02679 family protein [Ilumatobacter sp.]
MDQPSSAVAAVARPDLGKLWDAARARLERNGRQVTTNPIDLRDLTDAEVTAMCALLARRRPPGNHLRVSLAELDRVLRSSNVQLGIVDALEAMSGPVDDRRAQRSTEREQRAALWESADAHPIAADEQVRRWLSSVRQRGRLTRLAVDDPAALLNDALDCLGWLTSNCATNLGCSLPLPVAAATLFGDAHALDADRPLGTVVADAVLEVSGLVDQRAAWLTFGIQLDSVSTAALTFMLPGADGSLVATARVAAEPLRLTQRMLDRGHGLAVRPGDVVWICENPSILTLAADRLGNACQPLVCLEGMPSAVTGRLLAALRQAGAVLRAHADFDLGGVAIMSHVGARYGAEPWRMGKQDYLAALDSPTTDLGHVIGATAWDPLLGPAMNLHRRAIHEEAILGALLDDLSR